MSKEEFSLPSKITIEQFDTETKELKLTSNIGEGQTLVTLAQVTYMLLTGLGDRRYKGLTHEGKKEVVTTIMDYYKDKDVGIDISYADDKQTK